MQFWRYRILILCVYVHLCPQFYTPGVQHVAAINDPLECNMHLQQLPTVLLLEMHQWLIVLLAGLFPSARGFGSVRGGPGGTASGCALGVGKADLRVASLSAVCVNRRC